MEWVSKKKEPGAKPRLQTPELVVDQCSVQLQVDDPLDGAQQAFHFVEPVAGPERAPSEREQEQTALMG
jgi:hypothetical protein